MTTQHPLNARRLLRIAVVTETYPPEINYYNNFFPPIANTNWAADERR